MLRQLVCGQKLGAALFTPRPFGGGLSAEMSFRIREDLRIHKSGGLTFDCAQLYQCRLGSIDKNQLHRYVFDLIEWNSRESFLLEHFVDHVVLHTKMREEGVAVIKCLLTREAPEHFQMNIVWPSDNRTCS